MKLLFTKSSLPASKLIRWALNEPVSHVVVLFFDEIVLHSNFVGVHCEAKDDFLQNSEVVFEYGVEISRDKELKILLESFKILMGNKYDFKAFFYIGWCLLKRKLFGCPLPKTNPYNTPREEICTEIASEVLGLDNIDASMVSPYQLYLFLKRQGETYEE